jgi:hypothetical protein
MTKLIALALLALIAGVWLKRRKLRPPEQTAQLPPTAALAPPTPAEAAAAAKAEAEALRTAIAALTAPALRGTITDGTPNLTDSRIGGPLAWPEGEASPLDDLGRPLILLAQINLAQLPTPLDLPSEGLLQVLIATDDQFGCAFPSIQGDGMRVVLHPAGLALSAHPMPAEQPEHTPFKIHPAPPHGHALHWQAIDCPPSTADEQIADLVWSDAPHSPARDAAIAAVVGEFALQRGDHDIMLRGNPDFTQEDPRHDPIYMGMVNLIAFSSSGKAFMWGDAGEACILLPSEDIGDQDLGRAIYYFDCC